jgi:segregation and condensation protein B
MSQPRDEAKQRIIEHVVPATAPVEELADSLTGDSAAASPGDPAGDSAADATIDPNDAALEEEALRELDASLSGESASAMAIEEAPEAMASLGEYRLRSVLESLFLVADRPLTVARIVEILEEAAGPVTKQAGPPLYQAAEIQSILLTLSTEYRTAGRGIELHQVAGAWQLRTAPDNATWVQRLLQQKPMRLARAQLEVMAIVAYRQPITRPEIDDVRGVDSGGALKTLLERRLVRILGKKEEPGRPLLYGTTREFLEFFNLRDLKDLPTLREYYDLSEEHKAKVRAEHGDSEPLLPLPDPAPPAPPTAASIANAPQPERVEIAQQHLVDDAEQLGKIDELIASVSTDFSRLEAILSPPPPPEPIPAAPPASSTSPAAEAPVDDSPESRKS